MYGTPEMLDFTDKNENGRQQKPLTNVSGFCIIHNASQKDAEYYAKKFGLWRSTQEAEEAPLLRV